MDKKKIIIFIALALFIFVGVRQIFKPRTVIAPSAQTQVGSVPVISTSSPKLEQIVDLPSAPPKVKPPPAPILIDNAAEKASTSIIASQQISLLDIPFTTQAPLAEWSDTRQQDGCEETSALMAVRWAEGLGALTKAEAKKEILAIAAFEEKNYQNFVDTSAADTLKIIINEYFGYQNAEVKEDSSIEEIKKELARGNALILPMDGKKLKNPNFKNGGPDRHNIVIRGYDPTSKEFITNDPGTRKGEGYRYPEKIIDAAWRDYPTGNHLPIVGIKKNMIVVRPIKK